MKRSLASLTLLCLLLSLLCPSVFALEATVSFDNVTYHGSDMSLPYFYTIESSGAVITDCVETINGKAVLPDTLGGYPVTGISAEAFSMCTGLTEIQIPNSVSVIADGAFSSCSDELVLCAATDSVAAQYAREGGILLKAPLILGDSDANGEVSLGDLTTVARLLSGWETPADVYAADLNEDLQLGLPDLTELAEKLAGFPEKTTIFVIGDSTACKYSDYANYRALSGYGEHLQSYLKGRVEVVNLASSGASSKDFPSRAPYLTLINNIKKGDFLFIGLGINDNKAADDTRYSDPTKDRNTPGSYQYYLYHNYVLPALNAGATPVFVTSVCRRPVDGVTFGATEVHITADQPGKPGGDYPAAMKALGEELNIPVLDMTEATKELHLTLGAEDNALLHKWETADIATLDKTHYSAFGARYVAFLLATAMKDVDALSPFVQEELTPPDKTDWALRAVKTEEPSVFVYSDSSTSLSYDTLISTDSFEVPQGATLTEAHLAEGVYAIKRETFLNQSTLKSVTLPDSLLAVGISAFQNCRNLELDALPSNLKQLHYNSFLGCSSITVSRIPESVTEIGGAAFYNCSSIETMDLRASVTALDRRHLPRLYRLEKRHAHTLYQNGGRKCIPRLYFPDRSDSSRRDRLSRHPRSSIHRTLLPDPSSLLKTDRRLRLLRHKVIENASLQRHKIPVLVDRKEHLLEQRV
ncbi:MAG: leucine-rich repeat protein [Clostridia bacterium]|nr:leucine-rich repeat protein [Clostridia bacterium]